MEDPERQKSIWLEVSNVRRVKDGVEIQVKGDKADREPVWWKVGAIKAGFGTEEIKDKAGKLLEPEKPDHDAAYRAIAEGLDKKRNVHANLAPATDPDPDPDGTTLKCTSIRIQYAESNSR